MCNNCSADHVVEPLLINSEDSWGRITERNYEMKYIFGSEWADSRFEIGLISIEALNTEVAILKALNNSLSNFSRLIDPPDIGNDEINDIRKYISTFDQI